ncbi:MAG: GGDEF domain-containing protein [Oleiphilaceae bacterium]|nr:GGDEF domain-containing protein [Oleiphilaceae bacterium]
MASDESWEKLYGQEVESAKAREKVWQEERHTFERLLVRTSFASEGQDPDLDRLLRDLRQCIRSGEADLAQFRAFQETLDQRLIAMDERKDQASKKLKSTLENLLATVRDHPLFATESAGLKKLGNDLKHPATFREQLPDWLENLARLEARALASDPGKSEKEGALRRFFGKRKSDKTADEPTITESDLSSATDLGAEELGEDKDQRTKFAGRVSELVEHMLAQVSLSPQAHARALAIRAQLARGQDWDDLREALQETSELVIAAVSWGQQEFESFLKRLDERLLALQSHLLAQDESSEDRQSASQTLESSLHKNLKALSHNMAEAGDMKELKHSVNNHLESLVQTVRTYREQEDARESLANQQMQVLREKLAAMEAYSEQTRDELKTERLRALTDVLTQLPNREAWQERLNFEYERWSRYRQPLTLGVLDIDYFKRVNDSYGHKAGDRVIQLMAKAVRERLRNTDFVARYGGEEFVVLLPETDVDTARNVIESLLAEVASLPFHFQGKPVTVTFSAGLAAVTTDSGADAVFDQADRALYEAKDAGRNRVVVAETKA